MVIEKDMETILCDVWSDISETGGILGIILCHWNSLSSSCNISTHEQLQTQGSVEEELFWTIKSLEEFEIP